MNGANYDYFYGEQAESYAFYRIPKLLFTENEFMGLSIEAKTVYGILLDRMSMSAKNGWLDEEGRVYVYMKVCSVASAMGCARQKAGRILTELNDFGLIERQKQYLGKPDRIYVKNFIHVRNSYILRDEIRTSGCTEIVHQDVPKSSPNNTKNNNTDLNKNNLILSAEPRDERDSFRAYFMDQWEYDHLLEEHPYDRELLDALMEIALDLMCSKQKYVRIEGDEKPIKVVQGSVMKLDSSHLSYLIDNLSKNSTKVRNVKQYLLAALYNAPLTMQTYYQSWVNHDMKNGYL